MNFESFDISNIRDKNYYSLLSSLVQYIRSKHYSPGEKLPQESLLAAELNTNRSTLRELLRVLEVLGVIDSQRGSGNVYLGNMEVGFMNLFLVSSMLGERKPWEYCSIRAAIESMAIESFIESASDTDMYRLRILCEDRLSGNVDKSSMEYLNAHIEFHDTLMKYYPNETARQLIHSYLRLTVRDYDSKFEYDSSLTPEDRNILRTKLEDNSHTKIMEAVNARDMQKARELIINHAFMTGIHDGF